MSTPYPKLPAYTGPSIQKKEEGKELKERIESTAARLKEAYADEKLASSVPCELKGEKPGAAAHGGDCPVCHKAHSVARTDEAKQQAALLYAEVTAKGVGGQPASKLYADQGNMFGVLICVDKDGNTKMLKAFSGSYAGDKDMVAVDGWSPMVPYDKPLQNAQLEAERAEAQKTLLDTKPLAREASGFGERIRELEKSIKANGGVFATEKGKITTRFKERLREPRQALYEAGKAEPRDDKRIGELQNQIGLMEAAQAEEIEKLAAESGAALEGMQKQLAETKVSQQKFVAAYELKYKEKPDKLQQKLQEAAKKADTASARVLEDEALNRSVANYRGEAAPFAKACAPHKPGGKTGWCAAPKLLADAKRQGLTPISMAEFWMGKPVGKNSDGDLVPSCDACRAFLGFSLCGLEEAQAAKLKELTADK